jgi:hypothetical protein
MKTHANYTTLFTITTWFILVSFACSTAPIATDTPLPTGASAPVATRTLAPTATLQSTPTLTPTLAETATTDQCVDVPEGLVGWWPGDGNAKDVFAGNNGTTSGGIGFANEKVRKAFSFNGIDSSVNIPRAASLDVGRQVSVEFWVKPALDNAMGNCCQGLVDTDYYLVELSGGRTGNIGVNFVVNTNDGFIHTSDKTNTGFKVPAGEWTFVVGTYDSGSLRLYINGKEEVQLAHEGRIRNMLPASFMAIGSEDGRTDCPNCINTRYFKGLIDEVSIYKRALTEAEIQSIYSAGEAGKCSLQQ